MLFARARIPSSVRDPRGGKAATGPWIEIPSLNLVTNDGKHRCERHHHRNLALSVYSSQRTVHADLEKNYCFIRAHTLTDLSVTKPRPRPGNFAGATPLVSTP